MKFYAGFCLLLFSSLFTLTASPFETPEAFESATAKNWKFECARFDSQVAEWDPEIDAHLKAFVLKTLREGLLVLQGLNPKLVGIRWNQLNNRKLRFECRSQNEGDAVTHYGFFSDAISLRQVGFNLALAANESVKERFEKSNGLNVAKALAWSKSVVLHEFLHFLRFNNLSTKMHSSLGDADERRQADAVYSCTSQAFPWDSLGWAPQGGSFINTQKACETCCTAEPRSPFGTKASKNEILKHACAKACESAEVIQILNLEQ